MLVFDPRKRINATECLEDEYVAPYHDPTDEPVAGEKFDWSFNDADLPVDNWKVMMYSEILGKCLKDPFIPYSLVNHRFPSSWGLDSHWVKWDTRGCPRRTRLAIWRAGRIVISAESSDLLASCGCLS